jgi:hypothetical protein
VKVPLPLGRLIVKLVTLSIATCTLSQIYGQVPKTSNGLSHDLSRYLSLTSQQRENIIKWNHDLKIRKREGRQLSDIHQQIEGSLSSDQRSKLELLESSPSNENLKIEARSLNLLSSPTGRRVFGGATTRNKTSTGVEEGTSPHPPPQSPPQ